MNWSSKQSWEKEDLLYSPKRKVNNTGSRSHLHIIGSIFSRKMNRSIAYESLWGECLFYYFLELDPLTIRYYEQPVSVPYQLLNEKYVLEEKDHVPDVLGFRQGSVPHLFQVKGGNEIITQTPHLYRACCDFASEKKWRYSVVHPKQLPKTVKSNLVTLMYYMNPRYFYAEWIPEIINKMLHLHEPTVEHLAKSFGSKTDHRNILPIIFHLIFIGELQTNIHIPINHHSVVKLGNLSQELIPFFNVEGDEFAVM